MPQVGLKHFGYSPAGYAAAKKESMRTGKKISGKRKSKAMTRALMAPMIAKQMKRGG